MWPKAESGVTITIDSSVLLQYYQSRAGIASADPISSAVRKIAPTAPWASASKAVKPTELVRSAMAGKALINEAAAQLDVKGIPLLLPLKTAIDGNRQAWLEDPDGNRIELMEMAPDSLQYAAIKRLHAEAGTA